MTFKDAGSLFSVVSLLLDIDPLCASAHRLMVSIRHLPRFLSHKSDDSYFEAVYFLYYVWALLPQGRKTGP